MSKLRKSAKGRECLIRIPGVCNWDPSTVVLCHQNGAGLALKSDDSEGAFGCSNCHSAVDLKPVIKHEFTLIEIKLMFLEGAVRTRDYWRSVGLLPCFK